MISVEMISPKEVQEAMFKINAFRLKKRINILPQDFIGKIDVLMPQQFHLGKLDTHKTNVIFVFTNLLLYRASSFKSVSLISLNHRLVTHLLT